MESSNVTSYKFLDPAYLFNHGFDFFSQLFHFLFRDEVRLALNTPLTIISLFFMTVIGYCAIRLFEIRDKEHKHLQHEIKEYAHHQMEKEKELKAEEIISDNKQWIQVLQHVFSLNMSDWKLAIIEADTILDGLMGTLGFKGDSLGEKLKSADQDSFRQLTAAWEVHTIRNRIAHEGLLFELSQYEAKRVVAIYEQIFREFGYI